MALSISRDYVNFPVKAIRILAYRHEAPGRAFSPLPCQWYCPRTLGASPRRRGVLRSWDLFSKLVQRHEFARELLHDKVLELTGCIFRQNMCRNRSFDSYSVLPITLQTQSATFGEFKDVLTHS